jgi:hypothetical protein
MSKFDLPLFERHGFALGTRKYRGLNNPPS